ncbi:MAG TPA: Ig-like domain-containing protein [Gammaproteobacteria bacterium]
MWNATRLIAINFILALVLAGCGGGGGGPSLPGDSGGVTSPDMPGGGNTDGNNDSDDGAGTGDDNNGGSGDGGNDAGNAEKLTVASTDPADNSELAAASTMITVIFDTLIDSESVNTSMIHVMGPSGTVNVDVSVEDKRLLLTPESAMTSGEYSVTIDAGIKNVSGVQLESAYSWQFSVTRKITGLCADFYEEDFSLIEGKNWASPLSYLPKPEAGVPIADPVYNTCIVRASNAKALGVGWVRNDYARRQAFNADSSLYLVLARYGRWFIHDANDTSIVRELKISGGTYLEPQWHPTNPNILYMLDGDGGLTISTYNVMTGESKVVADLRNVESIDGYPGYTSITQVWSNAARAWTRWEGSPSADARYWAFMVQTSSEGGLGMITYDMQTNTITGVYDYVRDGGGVPQPDHISMSPSGKYVVPSWNSPGCQSLGSLGTHNNPCGLMSFTRDFSQAVGLTMNSPHSDIGIDANGRDVIVAGDYVTGWVEMWDLETGERTHLWEIYVNGNSSAMHISAKSFAKPGWALISTYAEKAPGWYTRKIMAVELKANPRILNIAHTYNNYVSYWTEPHASVNRDFTRILFNSNWQSWSEDGDAYMITLPYDAVPAQ